MAAIGLVSVPAPANAADPSAPFVLPGVTLTAATADIDDDGAREVVRLADVGGSVVIETWDLVDGAWAATFSADIEAFAAPGTVVSEGMMPMALARARVDGVERVLVLAAGYDQERGIPSCCFTAHEIIDPGDGPEARAMAAPELAAELAVVVDIDGDGTDELALTSIRWNDSGNAATTSVEVLRRERDAWTSMGAWQDEGHWGMMPPVEADGMPGREILASGESGEVVRLAWIDGVLAESRSSLRFDGEQGWINGGSTNALLIALPTGMGLVEWPAGGEPLLTATYETLDYPIVGILGTGRDTLYVVQDHDGSGIPTGKISILDADLDPVGEVTISPEAQTLWERIESWLGGGGWASSRSIWPYVGPADGDWTGGARAFVIGGRQITAGTAGTFEVSPTRSLVTQPIGIAGPDDAWVALADGFYATGPVAHLSLGWYPLESRLVLAPAAALLEPVQQELATSVRFEGAIETGRTGEAVRLLAASTGAEIVVEVASGTVVISSDGNEMQDHGARDTTVRLSVPAPRRPSRDQPAEFERELLLIGPEGNVSFHRWEGTFAPEAPELTAWTNLDALSLEATVTGRASPGSIMTVDGETVALNQFGAYRATVSAPPWPRNVVVVARDPFGGEQRTTVQVIGLVDYRGLPWGPIAGALTVLVGGVFFLRTPRHRPAPQQTALDDARLEDLDGDAI